MNTEELIAKVLSGNASPEEIHVMEIWRNQDNNEFLYKEYEKVWLESKPFSRFDPDTDKAWQKLQSSIKTKPITLRQVNARYFFRAAAVLVPITVLALILAYVFKGPKEEIQKTAALAPVYEESPKVISLSEIITTDSAQVFYLADSTKIYLNKNSSFDFPEVFDPNERVVYLEGEAFFEVRPDSLRPFIIYTESSITKVKGTSFNIKAYKGKDVEIEVSTGEVEFSSILGPDHTKTVLLSANETVALDVEKSSLLIKESKAKKATWRKQSRFRKIINKIKRRFTKTK